MPILNLKKTEDQADNHQERSDQINANLTVIKVGLEKGEDARLLGLYLFICLDPTKETCSCH